MFLFKQRFVSFNFELHFHIHCMARKKKLKFMWADNEYNINTHEYATTSRDWRQILNDILSALFVRGRHCNMSTIVIRSWQDNGKNTLTQEIFKKEQHQFWFFFFSRREKNSFSCLVLDSIMLDCEAGKRGGEAMNGGRYPLDLIIVESLSTRKWHPA